MSRMIASILKALYTSFHSTNFSLICGSGQVYIKELYSTRVHFKSKKLDTKPFLRSVDLWEYLGMTTSIFKSLIQQLSCQQLFSGSVEWSLLHFYV